MTLSWTLPGRSLHADLEEHGRESLPRIFRGERPREELCAFAEVQRWAFAALEDWVRMTLILQADGKWLRQHARDRGIFPQGDETDAELRELVRTPPDVVTPGSLLAAIVAILEAAGITAAPTLRELPREGWFWGDTATSTASSRRGFWSRGFRWFRARPGHVIAILPYPTSQATAGAVEEAIRTRKAGGIRHTVERREIP